MTTTALNDVRLASARETAVHWSVYAVLFASTSVLVGVLWDISWHQTIGRDTFWTPAHLGIYLGGVVAGLTCGYLALRITFAGTAREAGRERALLGIPARRSAPGSASGARSRC